MTISLTGIPANIRTPGTRREFIFAAGNSTGFGSDQPVVIIGNKTSAGSETADTLGTIALDDADVVSRFGRKSEVRWMYRWYTAIDPTAPIYIVAATESGGTAATQTITYTTTATGTCTAKVWIMGIEIPFTINSGDDVTTIAANAVLAINAAEEGGLPLTATSALGVVTLTTANKGPRFDYYLSRTRAVVPSGNGTTVAVSAVTSGTTEDDHTTAYSLIAARFSRVWIVSPKHTTSAPTSGDNGVGELSTMVSTQALPVNGKSFCAVLGFVGTQAQASTVATDTDINSPYVYIFAQKNSEWSPGMIAAHNAAVMRSRFVAYPAANLTNYRNDAAKGTIYQLPAQYDPANYWTSTEIEQLLKDGVTPIAATPTGTAYIARHITSRCRNAQSAADYRASEGHITPTIFAVWEEIDGRWSEQKQDNVSNDLEAGKKPMPLTDTPSTLRALIQQVIEEAAGPAPFGKYPGPLLDPSVVDIMKEAVLVEKIAGGLSARVDLYPVEHNLFHNFQLLQKGAAY